MVFWSDIEIIFTLFTPWIDGDFFGFFDGVPCIFQLHFVLCTLPRRENMIFFKSIGDPFLQFSIKTNALESIIFGSKTNILDVKMEFSVYFRVFSNFLIVEVHCKVLRNRLLRS